LSVEHCTRVIFVCISGMSRRPLAHLTLPTLYRSRYINNGAVVTEERQNPGQVSTAKWRALYRTYEVTSLLRHGKNVLGAVVISMAYSACLFIQYQDGTTQFVGCEDMKINGKGPYRLWEDGVEEHGGKCEVYLTPNEYVGWDSPDYDDSNWQPAIQTDIVRSLAEQTVVTTVQAELKPISLVQMDKKRYIADFGENIHGSVRIKATIPRYRRGTRIVIRYAEILNGEGELEPFTTMNVPHGEHDAQTDVYLSGTHQKQAGVEEYTSRFSMHGFRYAEISGVEGLCREDVTALLIHSPVGSESGFECSDPFINKLYEISRRAQRNNLVSIPTDCPHRERLGWLGDALVVAEAELIEWNVEGLLESWLASVRDEQEESGLVHFASPSSSHVINGAADIPWMSAAAAIPLLVYEKTGDKTILRENYDMMQRLVSFIGSLCDSDGLPVGGVLWNDHTCHQRMDPGYLGALYYYDILNITATVGQLLGLDNGLTQRATAVKEKINQRYYKNGVYSDGYESDIAHALCFGIADSENERALAEKLADLIREKGSIEAGALGLFVIPSVLAKYGYNDVMLDVLRSTKDGTFGAWITKYDATTAFERLNCDDYIKNKGNISMDHPFLMGATHAWLYRELGGIKPTKAGYAEFTVAPYTPETISYVNARIEIPCGTIRSGWRRTDEGIILSLGIPAGCVARVSTRDGEKTFGSGRYEVLI
ncbi:MAG: family 78 glycoside hydrolase catalytic domain, partial [Clostridia bacterium]|nr:family 78 glycoside hydrolase catalytic domain [Clostridia bacterium]